MNFNQEFSWLVDNTALMKIQLNMIAYLINLDTSIDSMFSQSSVVIGDVFMYQPVCLWLNLYDPEEVKQIF